jgi:hypothetical protein
MPLADVYTSVPYPIAIDFPGIITRNPEYLNFE